MWVTAIYLIWAASEIYLALSKRFKASSGSAESGADRSSFRVLWLTLVPSLIVGILLGLSDIGHIWSHAAILRVTGLVLIGLGLLLRWWAIFTLGHLFTVRVSILTDHKLVQHGPFRWIRHPAYAGSLLSFLGLGLSFANWLSILVIMLPILGSFLYRIAVEEKALEKTFGEEYTAYCRRVPYRLIPFIF